MKGAGFKPGAVVVFGGVPATPVSVDSAGQFITVLPPGHSEGEVDVAVRNQDGSGDVLKSAFTYNCPPVPDRPLFLLVVLAGALGGTLHGLRSLYWYVGNRWLIKSWALMYIVLPFTGALVAVIFYAVIRAGLIPLQSSKDTSLLIIAIAALVGMFSQQAALKLSDIGNAFFTKPGEGGESKPQGSLPPSGGTKPPGGASASKIDPKTGPLAGGQEVKITGTGLKSVKSVTFGGTTTPDPPTIAGDTITAKTPAHSRPEQVKVVITDDEGKQVSVDYTYS